MFRIHIPHKTRALGLQSAFLNPYNHDFTPSAELYSVEVSNQSLITIFKYNDSLSERKKYNLSKRETAVLRGKQGNKRPEWDGSECAAVQEQLW